MLREVSGTRDTIYVLNITVNNFLILLLNDIDYKIYLSVYLNVS